MACRECHFAKVKCDRIFPCSRCTRLNLHCVPHKSNQGKGRKRKFVDPLAPFLAGEDTISKSTPVSALKPDHYGIQFMIHSWIAIAFRRRSFSLLEKACSLANRAKMPMDKILCGKEGDQGDKGLLPDSTGSSLVPNESSQSSQDTCNKMDFMLSVLLTKKEHQKVSGSPLNWSELPKPLLEATGNSIITEACLSSRWIFIRENCKGIARFFASPAFERDVVTWEQIQKCWEDNEKEVLSLFVPGSETPGCFRLLAHQISLYAKADTHPPATRSSSKIMLRGNIMIDVDMIFCVHIVNLDHSFTLVEFLPKTSEELSRANAARHLNSASASKSKSHGSNNSSTSSIPSPIRQQGNQPHFLLDGWKNNEIDEFISLLKGKGGRKE